MYSDEVKNSVNENNLYIFKKMIQKQGNKGISCKKREDTAVNNIVKRKLKVKEKNHTCSEC